MPKIFFIGNGLKSYSDALSARGYEVNNYNAVSRAFGKIDSAGLLVLNRDNKEDLKELARAARKIPKILISNNRASKRLGHWLREPQCYPLYEPSEAEFLGFTLRILKEGSISENISRLRAENTLMRREIEFFEEMNRTLTASRDLNDILKIIIKGVKGMTQADACSVFLSDADSGDLVMQKIKGRSGKKTGKTRLKRGEGIAGWVAARGVPLVVPDVSKDRRYSPGVDKYGKISSSSIMCAPIKSKGTTIGVLEAIKKGKGSRFTKQDLSPLLRLVDQAALAVERITLYQKMEELAIKDDLTNLFNSRYLNRSIDSGILRSKQYSTSISMIFMDLDHFKDINDNFGHVVGSKLLVEIGQLLLNLLRSIDIVARYGGDEFVIILPQTILNNATIIAERIRKDIEEHHFLTSEGYDIRITSSFGVAAYPESAKSKEELLRLADEAMYTVKKTSRNGVYAII
jgi:diguanylate cyclase (GGDEF)-like protein